MRKFCLPLLFVCVCAILHGQSFEKIIFDYDDYVLDHISSSYQLRTRLEKHRPYIESSFAGFKVAILGQSSDNISDSGFNPQILTALLQLIKEDKPKAVFFNGNLAYSLLESSTLTKNEEKLQLPVEKNIFGNVTAQEYGIYSNEAFKQALVNFKQAVQDILGKEIPFYPLMGVQEAIGPDTAEIFQQHFDLENAAILDSNQLVYTIPIDNALFLAISTDFYSKDKNAPALHSLSPSAEAWLQETLKNEGDKYPFRFVIGSDPAFSTSAVFEVYKGLDQDKPVRNRLWKLLMDHKVRGYFSGGEILYDRTYRYGIWQIITGGAGSPNADNDAFEHFVLLSIPQEPTQDPLIQVFDSEGDRRDQFEMTKNPPFLFDLRISKQP